MATKRRPGKKKATDMVTTTVSLERDMYRSLRHLAVDEDSNVRDLIRKAVAEFLRKRGGHR